MISVPAQLSGERFIVLSERGKNPVQKWSTPEHQYNAAQIQKWCDAGWNYGVIYTSDLCVFDADAAERLVEIGIIQSLPETFTVMSGRATGLGLHLYYRMPEPPEGTKIYIIDDDGVDLGDIRLPHSKFYNVGPTSIHPNGNPYTILRDVPIATLDWPTLRDAISRVQTRVAGVKRPITPKTNHGKQIMDEYGFNVLDFLAPRNPRQRPDGEVEGEHPVHGSTSGSNLTVSAGGTLWWCRRCGSGGNWIDALAVSEGIIGCSESRPGRVYSADEWKKINHVLRRLRPDVYAEQKKRWIAEQSAARLDKLRICVSGKVKS